MNPRHYCEHKSAGMTFQANRLNEALNIRLSQKFMLQLFLLAYAAFGSDGIDHIVYVFHRYEKGSFIE